MQHPLGFNNVLSLVKVVISVVKAELNVFKNRLVPKMKLTLSIGQLKLGGNGPSLIDRCQILSPIQQSSIQQ